MAGNSSSSSTSPYTSLPITALIHFLTIKLDSTNYLLWRDQVEPLLRVQRKFGFIDLSIPPPPPTIAGSNNTQLPNPEFITWSDQDQLIRSLLVFSVYQPSIHWENNAPSNCEHPSTLCSLRNKWQII